MTRRCRAAAALVVLLAAQAALLVPREASAAPERKAPASAAPVLREAPAARPARTPQTPPATTLPVTVALAAGQRVAAAAAAATTAQPAATPAVAAGGPRSGSWNPVVGPDSPAGPRPARLESAPEAPAPAAPAPASSAPAPARVPGAYYGNAEPTIWQAPTFVLLGDSLTELGLDYGGGWSARLAHGYSRRADVLNRGFGGFNSQTMLLSMPEILDSVRGKSVRLATVWLGANDASMPDRPNSAAHVPPHEYFANLKRIVSQLQDAGVENVVLFTPPPVNENAPRAVPPGETLPARTYKFTSVYAAAARTAARESGVPLLDVWELFESQDNWQTTLLSDDGLHLSPKGQELVFNGLVGLVASQLPQIKADAMPWHHPTWWFIDYANASAQFAAEEEAFRVNLSS